MTDPQDAGRRSRSACAFAPHRKPGSAGRGPGAWGLVLAGGALLAACALGRADTPPAARVLLLNSYHPGSQWSAKLAEGVRASLSDGRNVDLFVEYMDTKRQDPAGIYPALTELYRVKYRHLRPDVIVCADNNALDFLLARREELFADVPVVFCGINNFCDSMLAGHDNITGVAEDVNAAGTLELIRRLQPGVRQVAVISDVTPTSRLNLIKVRSAADRLGVDLILLDEQTADRLRKSLLALPADTAILYLDFYRTPVEEVFTLDEGLAMTHTRPDLPVYSLWEDKIRNGVVGGVLTTAEAQGRSAGRLAGRILDGARAEDLPIIRTSPWVTVLNAPAMARHGFSVSAVPPGAVVLNRQRSFYQRHAHVLWTGGSVVAGLVVVIALLAVNTMKRRRSEAALRESEERFRSLVEEAPMSILLLREGKYIYGNPASVRLLGFSSSEEIVGQQALDTVAPEYHQALQERMDRVARGESNEPLELQLLRPDGSRIWTLSTSVSVRMDGQPTAIIVGQNITPRKQAEEALREAVERERQAIRAARLGLWDWDLTTGRVRYSAEWKRQIGYDDHEISDDIEEWRSRVHPDDLPATQQKVRRCIEEGHADHVLEFRFRHRDGRYLHILAQGSVICDETGQAVRMLGSHVDITPQKQAEQRLRTVLEGLPGEVFVHDTAGRFRVVNEAACRNTGYTREELLALSVADIASNTEARERVPRLWEQVRDKRGTVLHSKHRRKDGSSYPVEVHIEAVELDGESAMLAIAFDITRQRQQELLQAKMLETAIDGIWLVNSQGRLLAVNPAGAAMLGYEPEELIGASVADVEARESRETVIEHIRTLTAKGYDRFETQHRRKDGQVIDVEISVSALGDTQGRVIAFVRDVTERKASEAEHLRLEEQYRQAQKMEAVGQLAGGVAHDFNNMLSVILGGTELALGNEGNAPELNATLRDIQRAAQRSADLTRQLLAFARKQTVAPRVLDLNETVCGMLKMLQRLIGEEIHLDFQGGENLWAVRIDPTQIDQILANLCVNARDAIEGLGRVDIRTANATLGPADCAHHAGLAPGEYAKLSVRDDGCGMDAETRARLFEPFYTTKGPSEGSGLGLSTVYGIVKQNGGFIDVASEPGHGAVFDVYLPRYAGRTETTDAEADKDAHRRASECILFVEDEPAILKIGRAMLEGLGYRVMTASTPSEALRLAEEHAGGIELLMTDVVMPEMNGKELADRIVQIHPGIRQVFMSGYTADVIAHHGVLKEGVHFIQKPFTQQELAGKLREALNA